MPLITLFLFRKNVSTLQYIISVGVRKANRFSDNLSNVQGHYQEVQTVIETDPMPLNVGFCASSLLNDVL